MRIKSTTILLVLFLFVFLQVASSAAYRQVGGYVYEGDATEGRFVDNVWNFISQFDDGVNPWEAAWGMNWSRDQYYWCETFQFDDVYHHMRVDYMDLAYYSGHGNNWLIGMRHADWPDERVFLDDAPGYGDLANGGDLEFIIFQSCKVITAPPDTADWYSKWWSHGADRGIFQGLHQACGYRTNSNSGNSVSTIFGQRLKTGQPVWQAWFGAVNDQRAMSGGGTYPGYASAVMSPRSDGDTIYHYSEDPPENEHWLRIYWQS